MSRRDGDKRSVTGKWAETVARGATNAYRAGLPRELRDYLEQAGATQTRVKPSKDFQQQLMPYGPDGLSKTELGLKKRNAANSVCAFFMGAMYLLTFLLIVGLRNWGVASQNMLVTYCLTTANFLTANGVDSGGNGTSPITTASTLTVQLSAYLLSAPFLWCCVWFVVAAVNTFETGGWLASPFRWIVAGDSHAKFFPCLVEAVALTMVELALEAGEGNRVFDTAINRGGYNLLLAFIAHKMAWQLELMFGFEEVSKDDIKGLTAGVYKIFRTKDLNAEEAADQIQQVHAHVKKMKIFEPLTQADADLALHTFVASTAVALKMVPITMRYNAMPIKPYWIQVLFGTVWTWNLFFTSIPYAFFMWGALLAYRSGWSDASGSILVTGRIIAWFTHVFSVYVFIAIAVGASFPQIVPTGGGSYTLSC